MPKLTLDCAKISSGRIKVSFQADEIPSGQIEIEALRCLDERFITELTTNGSFTPHDSGQILVGTSSFFINYEISSRFHACMGSHVDWSLNYAFFNPTEAYLGSGLLPVMGGYEQLERSLWYDLNVINFLS